METSHDVGKATEDPLCFVFQTTDKNEGAYNYRKHVWDLSGQLDAKAYMEKSPWDDWELAAEVRGDDKVKAGYRIVPFGKWRTKPFVVYLMVINGKIIKGGKSKGPIQTRSYSAGTEEKWTMRGSPSPTNYIFSQIFRMCVANNIPVQFWCHACEINTVKWIDAYGNEQITQSSAYEEIESSLNQHLRETLGRHPIGDGGLLELKKA